MAKTRGQFCGTAYRPLRGPYLRFRPLPFLGHPRPQPFLDQAQHPSVGDAVLDKLDQPFVRQIIEGTHDTLPITSTSPNA